MHVLRFLGEVDVALPGAAMRQLSRPRSIAILAYLAAAERGGVTRDRLAVLFWEETDRHRARHSLSNQLHILRKSLGDEAILTPGEFVRLNPEVVTADVADFKRAFANRDLEGAARLYRGPFLDGFHLGGVGEFERWLEDERRSLAVQALDAFEGMAELAETAGEPVEAMKWLQRAFQHDPYNSRAAVALARALAAGRDPGNAVQLLRQHVQKLEEDLGIESDPAILELIQTGQFGVEARDLLPGGHGATRRHQPDEAVAGAAGDPPRPSSATVAEGETTVGSSAFRMRRMPTRAAAGIAVLALLTIVGGLSGLIRGKADLSSGRLALLPARPIGVDSGLSALVTEQLHSELVEWETHPVVLPEETGTWTGLREEEPSAGIGRRMAARVGTGKVLIPSVSRSGNRISLSASLVEIPSGQPVAAARAAGPPDSLASIVHALVVQLAAKEHGIPADRIATLAQHDPAAVRLFVRSHPHDSEVRDRLLREAIALDSTFALAALEMYESFDDYVTPDGDDPSAVEAATAWDAVAGIVWENRDYLSPADRSYAEALLGWRYNEEHTARLHVAAWERAVEVAPDRLAHWQGLFGECFRWCSSYRWEWQKPLLEVHDELVARGDSSFLEHAMEVAFFLGDTARLRSYESWLPADAWYGRWLAATGLGREADRAKVAQKIPDLSNSHLMQIGNAAIMTGLGLEDAEREARIREKGTPGSIYSLRQTVLARERGHHAEYRRLRGKLFQYFDVRTGTDAIGAANVIFEWGFFAEPETDETLDEIDGMLSRIVAQGKNGSPDSLAVAQCYRAQLRLLRGDTTDVAEAVRFLHTDPAARGLALSRMCAPFLEYLATRGEDQKVHAAAAGRLHDVMRDRPLTLGRGPGLFFVDINLAASVNLELARSFGELGHPETGLQMAERRPYQASFWGLYGFHIDFVRQEARLLAQAGETEAALARYEKYFRLRPEPPDLESWADEWEAARAEYEALRESAVG